MYIYISIHDVNSTVKSHCPRKTDEKNVKKTKNNRREKRKKPRSRIFRTARLNSTIHKVRPPRALSLSRLPSLSRPGK